MLIPNELISNEMFEEILIYPIIFALIGDQSYKNDNNFKQNVNCRFAILRDQLY